MAYTSYDDNLRFLKGQNASPFAELQQKSASPAEGGGGGAIMSSTAAAPVSTQDSPTTTATQPIGAAAPSPSPAPQEGPLYDRLFQPLQEEVSQSREGLQQATTGFYDAAGPERTFWSIGGREQLRQGLQPGADEQPLKSLVNAQYVGPQGLNNGDGFYADPNLRGRQQAYQSGSGLAALTQNAVSGMTPGMARYEAQSAFRDPQFQQRRELELSNLDELFQDITAENQKAESFADTRAEQEATIARKSRDYLGERQAKTLGVIDQRVAERNAANEAAAANYQRFLENPYMGLKESENPRYQNLVTRSSMDEQNRARRMIDRIDSEYQDVANIPPLKRMPSGRGLDMLYFTLDGKTYSLGHARDGVAWGQSGKEEMPRGMTAEDLKALAMRLDQRQGEIEKYFGSPVNLAAGQQGGRGFWHSGGDPHARGSLAEIYSSQFPEAFGNEPLPDIRSTQYTTFNQGNAANLGNTATANQREQLDKISSLLGEAQKTFQSNPFEAAKMVIQVKDFLEAEEKALEARRGKLTAAEQEHKKAVRAVRSRYNESKDDWIGDAMGIAGLAILNPGMIVGGNALTQTRGQPVTPSPFGQRLSEVQV